MSDARLQLAFGGLHPDRMRTLVEQYGVTGTLRRLQRGQIKASARARQAMAVDAGVRRTELRRAIFQVLPSSLTTISGERGRAL